MKQRTLSELTVVSGNIDAKRIFNKSWNIFKNRCSWLEIMKNRGCEDMDDYTKFIYQMGWDGALLDIPEEKIKK